MKLVILFIALLFGVAYATLCTDNYEVSGAVIEVTQVNDGYVFDRNPAIIPNGRFLFRRGLIFVVNSVDDWTCVARNVSSTATGITTYLISGGGQVDAKIAAILKERLDVEFWTLGGYKQGGLNTLLYASRFQRSNRRYDDGNTGWIGIDTDLTDSSLASIHLLNMAAVHVYSKDGSTDGFDKMPLAALARNVTQKHRDLTNRCSLSQSECLTITSQLLALFSSGVGSQNQYDALNYAYKYISLLGYNYPILQDGYWTLNYTGASTAVVFFPGAKIDTRAYMPLLDRIRNAGYDVHIVVAPLGSAATAPEVMDRFRRVLAENGPYDKISVMGHSAGGAGIYNALLLNIPNVKGLFSLAAGTSSLLGRTERMDLIYGSLDGLFGPGAAAQIAKMPPTTTVTVIPGGNHHQDSSYDFLDFGDNLATICREAQHDYIYNAMINHLEAL